MNEINNKETNNILEIITKLDLDHENIIEEIIKKWTPEEGYIYCLYNEMFNYYGDNIYKLGCSKNPEKRMSGYTTSFIKPCEFKIISNKYLDCRLAENLLFKKIGKNRIEQNREFFKINIEDIKKEFQNIQKFFENKTKEEIIKYLIEEYKNDYTQFSKIQSIINAKDITSAEYEVLIEKQKKGDAIKDEKLSIIKAIYKKSLGVDKIDKIFLKTFYSNAIYKFISLIDITCKLEDLQIKEDIDKAIQIYKKSLGVDKIDEIFLKTFSQNAIYKFISLIDIKNIAKSEDLQVKEEIDKIIQIKKLVNDLGFKNIFDKKFITNYDFEKVKEKIIKNSSLFIDLKKTKTRFNLHKIRFNLHKTIKSLDNKAFNGFVNQLLNQYYLNLKYDRKRFGGKKIAVYKLVQMNDINELLQYKINKGFKIEDSENIRPISTTTTYKDYLYNFEDIIKNYKDNLYNFKPTEKNELNEWFQSIQQFTLLK